MASLNSFENWRKVGPHWWTWTAGWNEAIDEAIRVLRRTEPNCRMKVSILGLRRWVFPAIAYIRWSDGPRWRAEF